MALPPILKASIALHVAGTTGLLLSPGWWPGVCMALIANHAILTAGGLWPRSWWLGPNLRRLPAPAPEQGEVALTFDDGPDPVVTPRVLELLGSAGAAATFFVVGDKVEAHPELAAEVAARGHLLGNHTSRHSHAFAFYPPHALAREIDRAQDVIAQVTGTRPQHFRAPAGIRAPWLEPLLATRNLSLVSWTRRGYDTVAGEPQRVLSRLLRGVRGGDILLLHDGTCARTATGRPVVLEVLPVLLEELSRRDLRTVLLPRPRRS
jgi:peptidoglycan/xylan/chitin deacetylase (PgdA/CDA1 family)